MLCFGLHECLTAGGTLSSVFQQGNGLRPHSQIPNQLICKKVDYNLDNQGIGII